MKTSLDFIFLVDSVLLQNPELDIFGGVNGHQQQKTTLTYSSFTLSTWKVASLLQNHFHKICQMKAMENTKKTHFSEQKIQLK